MRRRLIRKLGQLNEQLASSRMFPDETTQQNVLETLDTINEILNEIVKALPE